VKYICFATHPTTTVEKHYARLTQKELDCTPEVCSFSGNPEQEVWCFSESPAFLSQRHTTGWIAVGARKATVQGEKGGVRAGM
jgi:hypothetical protein